MPSSAPPPPDPAPDPEDDRPATALGRFLRWLTPAGPRDDWLEPDLDPDGEDGEPRGAAAAPG
ncbi:hypothetical protein [Actinomadura atramentaria]|uniref:hypothetical protein n=1 Tax=Actinomadura atramentaria TaxID=1990 RepID=UPI00036AD32A|nr:hypothetical protein [Actinomadura atramentaria]